MASFLASQMDYVYFCYGLALLLLAVTCFALARRQTGLLPWHWLALFGALRGVHEWLELLSYSTGPSSGIEAASACLVFISGMALFEFGRAGVARFRGGAPRRFVLVPVAAIALLGLLEGAKGLHSSTNLATSLVGGLLSTYALVLASRTLETASRRHLRLAGVAFAILSISSSVLYLHPGLSFSFVVNREVLRSLTGMPVQMFNGLLVAWIAALLMDFFNAPLAEGRKIFIAPVYISICILFIGLFAAWMFGRSTENEHLDHLLKRTETIAAALDVDDIASLTGTRDDMHNPSYRLIRRQLMNVHDINSDSRFVYLMGLKDGKLVFLVDAEPEGSKDYSAPGDVYTDAKPRDFENYTAGRSTVYPPYTDSWGTWVSGVSPVVEPESGRILAQVGVDVDAADWMRSIALHRLLIIAMTAILCVVQVYAYLGWLKSEEQRIQRLKEKTENEKALMERERFLDNVFNCIQDGIAVVDSSQTVVRTNPSMERWFGMNMPLVGKKCHVAFRNNETPCLDCPISQTLRTVEPVSTEVTCFFGGAARCLEHFTYPMTDSESGGLTGAIGYFRDITERKKAESIIAEDKVRLEELAHHDALTGLPNRALFNDRLEQALKQARRRRHTASVIFIDLDNFKNINDTLGHDAGDRLLKEAAGRFRDCLREEDTIARLGGDEFAVILPHVEGVRDACHIAERLQASLKEPFEISGREHYAGLSMGVAFFPGDGKDPQTLLSSADIALYRAKEAGRNNFQIFTAEMDRTVREHAELEVALRSALDKKEFVLHFQPQMDLASGRASCLEALVRWDRPGTGLVPPDKFIPVAEDTRLIIPLGEWVLMEACLNCAGWGDGVRVAVNLSAKQFQQKDLARQVEQALKDAGLAPDRLELEITESAIMRDVDLAVKMLARLDQMGVRISIDDFGIGYSSFSYIKKFPLHVLKIDRTFVKNVTTDKNDAAISSAIVAMAHALHLRVVAEGVETGPQMEFLRGIGCDLAQGNLISLPMTPADVEAFLQSRKNSAPA